jgi:hypothetical protein
VWLRRWKVVVCVRSANACRSLVALGCSRANEQREADRPKSSKRTSPDDERTTRRRGDATGSGTRKTKDGGDEGTKSVNDRCDAMRCEWGKLQMAGQERAEATDPGPTRQESSSDKRRARARKGNRERTMPQEGGTRLLSPVLVPFPLLAPWLLCWLVLLWRRRLWLKGRRQQQQRPTGTAGRGHTGRGQTVAANGGCRLTNARVWTVRLAERDVQWPSVRSAFEPGHTGKAAASRRVHGKTRSDRQTTLSRSNGCGAAVRSPLR